MRVFDAQWFGRHQRALLGLLNAPVIGREFRSALCINETRRIVAILPHAYAVEDGDVVVADFRTHDKYAKRLFYQFKPLWRAAHEWDRFVAEPLCPALDLGFATLTAYPDPGSGTTCDGYVAMTLLDSTWLALHDAATADTVNTTDASWVAAGFRDSGTTNQFTNLYRSIYTFDTSALGATATISATTFSLYGVEIFGGAGVPYQDDLGWATRYDVYAATPDSMSSLTGSDYAAFGVTTFTGSPLLGTSLVLGYNDWTFNATGIAGVALTGITALGFRGVGYDVSNVNPNTVGWSSFAQCKFVINYADAVGTSSDPKLVVTYTTGAPGTTVAYNQGMLSRVAARMTQSGYRP